MSSKFGDIRIENQIQKDALFIHVIYFLPIFFWLGRKFSWLQIRNYNSFLNDFIDCTLNKIK